MAHQMCAKNIMFPIKHTLTNIISKFKLTWGVQIANKKVSKKKPFTCLEQVLSLNTPTPKTSLI